MHSALFSAEVRSLLACGDGKIASAKTGRQLEGECASSPNKPDGLFFNLFVSSHCWASLSWQHSLIRSVPDISELIAASTRINMAVTILTSLAIAVVLAAVGYIGLIFPGVSHAPSLPVSYSTCFALTFTMTAASAAMEIVLSSFTAATWT